MVTMEPVEIKLKRLQEAVGDLGLPLYDYVRLQKLVMSNRIVDVYHTDVWFDHGHRIPSRPVIVYQGHEPRVMNGEPVPGQYLWYQNAKTTFRAPDRKGRGTRSHYQWDRRGHGYTLKIVIHESVSPRTDLTWWVQTATISSSYEDFRVSEMHRQYIIPDPRQAEPLQLKSIRDVSERIESTR